LQISIHLDGKRILRAIREAKDGEDVLREADGGEILAAFPFASLLDDEDVLRLREAGTLPLEIFCEGSRRMTLGWIEEEGVVSIIVETEAGSHLDVHDTSISALLPRRGRSSGRLAAPV
jgi:hypothetical protein